MASAHAFMDLTPAELGYFISQVGLAATSFGVSSADVTAVAGSLNKLFGYRCSPPTVVIPEMGATLNTICQNSECPLDAMATCAAYPSSGMVSEPTAVKSTGMPTGTMSSDMATKSMTASAEPHCSSKGACGTQTTAVASDMSVASMNGTQTMMPTGTTTAAAMFTGAAGHVGAGAGVGAVVGALALGLAF
jgi:hypothetical protein